MNPVSDLGMVGFIIFWGITLLAAGIFFYRGYQLLEYLRLGKKGEKYRNLIKRTAGAVLNLVVQRCQYKNLRRTNVAPVGHLLMVWGFLLFVTYYLLFIVVASGFGISQIMENNPFYVYYTWVMDIFAPLIMLGALWGIIRRYIVSPPRIKQQRTYEALLILITVLIHPITHVGKIATQIAAGHPPAGLGIATPPISTAISTMFTNAATIEAWHTFWFWSHWGFVIFVLAIIGYTRYLHMIAGVFNYLLRYEPPKGTPELMDLNMQEHYGAGRIDNFTQKELLDTYACVSCGYCQDACPAVATGKTLNPRLVIRDIKTNLLTNGPQLLKMNEPILPLIGGEREGSISEETIWECTTCGACMEVCPVYIEHVREVIDMRRYLVLERASLPERVEKALRSIEDIGHPWRGTQLSREDWAKGFDICVLNDGIAEEGVEYLFWIGCTMALQERSIKITQAVANLLKESEVKFGILGFEESCCGEPARRFGNEYLFQIQARKNIELINRYGIKKIITACPHCYHVLKNEYPELGGNYEVLHHSEFIMNLIEEGKIKINNQSRCTITYQDSCYLGRYNNIYQPPRKILGVMPGLNMVEMEKAKEQSFCCGGGGGHMWMERGGGEKINEVRFQQAIDTGASAIATACPWCLEMLEDAATMHGEGIKVLDVAEIIHNL